MNNMQAFYSQLVSANSQGYDYLGYMAKLTRFSREQITSLRSLMWWNTWGADTR